jgi:hypothetical protein
MAFFRARTITTYSIISGIFGKIEQTGCIRAKDERMCLIGQLSCYFFYIWHIAEIEFPDFTNRAAWYDDKLFASDAGASISVTDSAHRQQEKDAFTACTCKVSSITHTGRKQVRVLSRCSEHVKAKAGRWNQTSLSNSYESVVDDEALLLLAGFGKNDRPFLPRDLKLPPLELQRKIFPKVDGWLELINKLNINGEAEVGEEVDSSMACHSFLMLLVWMRSVFLQDSVALRELCPSHPIWNHEIFQSPLYIKFCSELKVCFLC